MENNNNRGAIFNIREYLNNEYLRKEYEYLRKDMKTKGVIFKTI